MKKTLFKLTVLLLLPVLYYFIASGFTGTIRGHLNSTKTVPVTQMPVPGGKDFKIISYNKSYVDTWDTE